MSYIISSGSQNWSWSDKQSRHSFCKESLQSVTVMSSSATITYTHWQEDTRQSRTGHIKLNTHTHAHTAITHDWNLDLSHCLLAISSPVLLSAFDGRVEMFIRLHFLCWTGMRTWEEHGIRWISITAGPQICAEMCWRSKIVSKKDPFHSS